MAEGEEAHVFARVADADCGISVHFVGSKASVSSASADGIESKDGTIQVINYEKFASNSPPAEDRFVAPCAGELVVTFDNSYSWMKSKTVKYVCASYISAPHSFRLCFSDST